MASLKVTSCVIRVADLDRSTRFYCELFDCTEAIREPDAALLLSPNGFQLYLCLGRPHAGRPIRSVGVERLVWSVDSEAELRRIARHLRACTHDHSTFSCTRNGITFVDGMDPDGIRVLITHPAPSQFPREVIDAQFR